MIKIGQKLKKCSKCNIEFTCHDSGNSCWCNNYHLNQEKLNYLKANFDNCLCEECIKIVVKKV